MSIQPLPGDVVAQIKSSAVITSLNGAICGLLQNSLDACASKVSISVDYSRGNCSVEDNGVGITPASFHGDGGLGKPHCTSKYPPQPASHGKRGEFLASLAALSLLSIASHHRDYRTHNSLTIHNSRVVARNIPALPDQRVLAYPSGTRVVVRDLFGSMPVRVKQRALEVERLGSSREFDELILSIVSLLLPWPGEVAVTVQDQCTSRALSLHTPGVVDWSRSYLSTRHEIPSRTARLLIQASIVEKEDLKTWVPVGATASGISARGCVSLRPAATRRVQFIALGIQPLLNERHSNVMYEEFNRVFADSAFGVIEETSVDDDSLPAKTQGFTKKELRLKKGVDRWPMFFLQIMLETRQDSIDAEEFLNDKHQYLAVITDLLQVMAYEFLKKHHFRPKPVNALERLKRPKSTSPASPSEADKASTSVPWRDRIGLEAQQLPSKPQTRGKAPSQQLGSQKSEPRPVSPFASWPRVKSSEPKDGESKFTAASSQPPRQAVSKLTPERDVVRIPSGVPSRKDSQLFDKAGNLLRKPFDDGGEASTDPSAGTSSNQPYDSPAGSTEGGPRQAVIWVDPATKIKSLIDARTGFAVKSASTAERKAMPRPEVENGTRHISRLRKWKPTAYGQKTTLFQPAEPPIPHILQVSETLGFEHDDRNCACHDLGGINVGTPNGNLSMTLDGRISKTALRKAQVLGQVDRKFILAKVPTERAASSKSEATGADCMLIVIDQHAADERCRVEDLLKTYFIPDPAGSGRLVAQAQSLERPLRFDLPSKDVELLIQFKNHFMRWGVGYEVHREEAKHQQDASGSTVEVQTLPSSILERCRLEPKLLVELLRKETWKLHGVSSRQFGARDSVNAGANYEWVSRLHDCPEGILDLINSRACRSAIMFNDPLTGDQCSDLVQRLASCAFPFQCAHGRPSMVPLVHLSSDSTLGSDGVAPGEGANEDLWGDMKRWKRNMKQT
ncbi:hypothetical protein VTK56DRAFT_8822 [Thermocarpiscus australiensis]